MSNRLHCADCGAHLMLYGSEVFCPKCEHIAPLAGAFITLTVQAALLGKAIDPLSVRPTTTGELTYSFAKRGARRPIGRASTREGAA